MTLHQRHFFQSLWFVQLVQCLADQIIHIGDRGVIPAPHVRLPLLRWQGHPLPFGVVVSKNIRSTDRTAQSLSAFREKSSSQDVRPEMYGKFQSITQDIAEMFSVARSFSG